MRTDQLRAIIYLAAYTMAAGEARRWLDACNAYCRRRTYQVAEIVFDHRKGEAWEDVLKAVHAGRHGGPGEWRADVIVVPDRSHLPAGRVPRVEAVVEENGHGPRPRFLHR